REHSECARRSSDPAEHSRSSPRSPITPSQPSLPASPCPTQTSTPRTSDSSPNTSRSQPQQLAPSSKTSPFSATEAPRYGPILSPAPGRKRHSRPDRSPTAHDIQQ